jgi:hypothetical protein
VWRELAYPARFGWRGLQDGPREPESNAPRGPRRAAWDDWWSSIDTIRGDLQGLRARPISGAWKKELEQALLFSTL